MRITITLFLIYLLRPVPSDVQLFIVIQEVHIMIHDVFDRPTW